MPWSERRVTRRARYAHCSFFHGWIPPQIQEDGVGISPDVLPRIFDAFITSTLVGIGTGLGLFVSHKIVSDLGGEIQVRSALGAGTTFRVALPSADDAD